MSRLPDSSFGGASALIASRYDQRFSFCVRLPSDWEPEAIDRYPLIVVVHGARREAMKYRDLYADLAEEAGAIVMAPLFPAGIIDPDATSNFALIQFHDIRYDHVLLAMIEEVAERYGARGGRVLLHGYSGGGQLANRMLLLHPERLRAVSIGAPGMVTLIEPTRRWWVGTADIAARFGRPLDLEAMRRVPVHMVVGAEDLATAAIDVQPDWKYWGMENANIAGATRVDRLRYLAANLREHGLDVSLDVVPGMAHAGLRLQDPVKAFFRQVLRTA